MRRFAILLLFIACPSTVAAQGVDWPYYGGDQGGMKYSPLDQIDRDNVTELEVLWTWDNGEEPITGASVPVRGETIRPGRFEATPIVINDTMYVSTPYSRVVALDARTGEEFWSYDPRAYSWGQLPRGCGFCHRGVAMWTDGNERRIFIHSRWSLISLDAATGQPIASFGQGGQVDVTTDLIWEINKLHYTNTSPPVVWGDLVILGSGMPDDRIYRRNPPGDVQAFNVHTGERVWTFHTIPQPGELGNDTWEAESYSYTGSTSVWPPFTVDEERGLVYLPVGTPNGDYYGGHRLGYNLFAESLVCLDARTGELVWHYQTVHHGIWDYDLPAPPNLVTIEVDGRVIDAVAQVTKQGFTFVFDRVTGEPVWPIEERPVAASTVPGERTAPTQPFPTKPAPFARQGFSLDDVIDLTPELRADALELIQSYQLGPLFTPPSLEGTITMPGAVGAVAWGGAAFDPRTHVLYVPSKNLPFVHGLVEPEPGTADADYVQRIRGLNVSGIPIVKPPWGTMTAIDLDSGDHLWQVAVGDRPDIRENPALAGVDLPPLGWMYNEGPMATGGDLVFLGGRNPRLYAIDSETGETLWSGDLLGNQGTSNPMTYRTSEGKQIVVIGVTGPGSDRGMIAFALPGA
jgi:quinoprotein glucose dehydrogenase